MFIKISAVGSASGLIISYSSFNVRHNFIIGDIFGLVMMISFGIWIIDKLSEIITKNDEFIEY